MKSPSESVYSSQLSFHNLEGVLENKMPKKKKNRVNINNNSLDR
jgi:hypothetical protein